MKNLKVIISGLLMIGFQAKAQSVKPENLTCFLDNKIFSMVIADPMTYVVRDQLAVNSYDGDLVKGLLEPGEENLRITNSSIYLEFAPHSCKVDPTNPRVIASCSYDVNKDELNLDHSSVYFTFLSKSASGATQTTSVSRSMKVLTAELRANVFPKPFPGDRPEDRIVANILLKVQIGSEVREVAITKNLGEWTKKENRSNWNRCLINN